MPTLLVIEIRHVALIVISPVTATAIVLNQHYVHYEISINLLAAHPFVL